MDISHQKRLVKHFIDEKEDLQQHVYGRKAELEAISISLLRQPYPTLPMALSGLSI